MNVLEPKPNSSYVEEAIRARQQYEQHEEERETFETWRVNLRFIHDPFWRSRFWSVQHVHDVAEGKSFDWFWTPFSYLFWAAQITFVMMPFLVYLDRSPARWWQLLLLAAGIEAVIVAMQNFIEWLHWYRFKHVHYKKIKVP